MSVHNEDEDINMDLQNEYGDEDEEEYKYVYSKEFRKTINKFIIEGETIENLNKFKTFTMSKPDLNIPTINHTLLNNYYYYY